MKRISLIFNTAIITFLVSSIMWGVVLFNQKEKTLNTLLLVNDQRYRIKELTDANTEYFYRLEKLKLGEFKFEIMRVLEEKRGIRVSPEVIDAIFKVSEEKGYDIPFLLAWAETETSLRANPKPWRKVKGILQINYNIWKDQLDLDKDRLSDPYYNISKATEILETYLDKSGQDLDRALFYYNNGPSGKYNNEEYSKKIFQKAEAYNSMIREII